MTEESQDAWSDLLTTHALEFNATRVRLILGYDADGKEQRSPRLVYDVKLAQGYRLKLASGESREDLQFRVCAEYVPPYTNLDDKGSMGVLFYNKGHEDIDIHVPPGLTADLKLPRPKFAELLTAAQHGICPESIEVRVKGLKVGFMGDDLEWDNSGKHYLPIMHVTFDLPLASRSSSDEDSHENAETPPTRGQLKALTERIDALVGAVSTIRIILHFLLAIAVGMAIWQWAK